MSGANVICGAAVDKRVRAVISQIPFVSGEVVSMVLGSGAQFVLSDRTKLTKDELSQMITVVPDSMDDIMNVSLQAILETPDVFPFLAALDERGTQMGEVCNCAGPVLCATS